MRPRHRHFHDDAGAAAEAGRLDPGRPAKGGGSALHVLEAMASLRPKELLTALPLTPIPSSVTSMRGVLVPP
jgi:hypothetical protein